MGSNQGFLTKNGVKSRSFEVKSGSNRSRIGVESGSNRGQPRSKIYLIRKLWISLFLIVICKIVLDIFRSHLRIFVLLPILTDKYKKIPMTESVPHLYLKSKVILGSSLGQTYQYFLLRMSLILSVFSL